MSINYKQRVTLFLNPKILKQAKIQAVVEEMSLAVLVEKVLTKYLPKETTIKKGTTIRKVEIKSKAHII